MAPKVAGVVNLDNASRDFELEHFVCFSSVTSVLGNPGQTDYAAANGFMDRYAAWRNSQVAKGECHGRTVSINWPLWADGGMQVDDAIVNRLKQSGQAPLGTEQGLASMMQKRPKWCRPNLGVGRSAQSTQSLYAGSE